MNAFQVFSITLLSVLAANAQVVIPGRCPSPAVQKDFDVTRYLGRWYGIQRLPNYFQNGDCSTATYSLKSPGVVGVLNRELHSDGTIGSAIGTAVTADPSEPAKLLVTFTESSRPGPYWVLSTDYENYTLVYSCTDRGHSHVHFAWIMSRQPTLPEETLEELRSILSSTGVKLDMLITTNQDASTCSVMQQ